MCTAATYQTRDFYMGRTLDYEFSYGEEIVITPRRFPIALRHGGVMDTHYAIIGTEHVAEGFQLYYDAVNEKGLGMAGLNFVGSAQYAEVVPDRENIAQFEFIPRLLGRCATLAEAREALRTLNLTGTPFSERLPASQLHWLLADKSGAVVIESVADGLKIYDDPAGVLTNNPPFPQQMFALNNFMHLSPKQPENLSSASRFVRAAFARLHSVSGEGEADSVGQFFHILGAVEQQNGCCEVRPGEYERTIYTSCWNADRGIYYYTTYTNRRISAVELRREDLDAAALIRYPMRTREDIFYQNAPGTES